MMGWMETGVCFDFRPMADTYSADAVGVAAVHDGGGLRAVGGVLGNDLGGGAGAGGGVGGDTGHEGSGQSSDGETHGCWNVECGRVECGINRMDTRGLAKKKVR